MEKYLMEERERNSGIQKIYQFGNGYGASVICNPYSYGGDRGLWELAVLDKFGKLTYDTPITDDVIGHLTWYEVENILKQIEGLE